MSIGKEHAWEKAFGDSSVERTQFIGKSDMEYRKLINLPKVDKEKMFKHSVYIHQIGAGILQGILSERKEQELATASLRQKQSKVGTLLRRRIKVSDLDDGGVAISIDQEWDTSTWSTQLIEAGCEALLLIFQDIKSPASSEKKDRAIQMLQKLLFRHEQAVTYLGKSIENMIAHSANKLIKGGRCGAVLDLLYVLESFKDRYLLQMTQSSFIKRAIEMISQEARLAAIIIQHTFRAKRSRQQFYALKEVIDDGFGSISELRAARLGIINARSSELRAKWRSMHWFQQASTRGQVGGVRGPVHVGKIYVIKILEILVYMVSRNAGKYAHGNREDVARSGGCIVLATFLCHPIGNLAYLTGKVLSETLKAPMTLRTAVECGCLTAVVKLMRYLRLVMGVGQGKKAIRKGENISSHDAYLSCLGIITNAGIQAGGFYRARQGYGFITEAYEEVERVDYRSILNQLSGSFDVQKEVKNYLGNPNLLKEISLMLLQADQPDLIVNLLQSVFTLLSGDAHNETMEEITSLAGTMMMKMVEHIYHPISSIGTFSLCALLQLCTIDTSRHALKTVHIMHLIPPLMKKIRENHGKKGKKDTNFVVPAYEDPRHERTVLLAVAVCRQHDWRFYDPLKLPVTLRQVDFSSDFTVDSGIYVSSPVREAVLLDVLRTLRCSDIADETADKMSLADLIVLPTETLKAEKFSQVALTLGAQYVAEYICHPEEPTFYEKLSIEELAASCIVLEALSANSETAELIFSGGLVRFLTKFLYFCKYLFLGKPMRMGQVMMVLSGIQSGLVALGRVAVASGRQLKRAEELVFMVREAELLKAVQFFMNTLSISHPQLNESTRQFQKVVGQSCLKFLKLYGTLLFDMEGKSKMSSVSDLYESGAAVVNLINYLKEVHGHHCSALIPLFSHACEVLRLITQPLDAAYMALQEWRIVQSLKHYLPPPISGFEEEKSMVGQTIPLDLIQEIDVNMDLYNSGALKNFTFMNNMEKTMKNSTFNNSLEDKLLDKTKYASDLTAEQFEKLEKLKQYKVSLMELPGAFFQLCANLCQNSEGAAHCLSEGFLRRAIDKLMLLHGALLVPVQSTRTERFGKRTVSSFSKWVISQKQRETCIQDLLGCLRLISKVANHNHEKVGSANDLILHPLFDVVGACACLIRGNIKDHFYSPLPNDNAADETKNPDILIDREQRSHILAMACYPVLSALARDSFRTLVLFEKHDIFAIISEELMCVEDMSAAAAAAALEAVQFSVAGLTSEYVVARIPMMRGPISKALRFFPNQLSKHVKDAQWSLTRSAMMYKATFDSYYELEKTTSEDPRFYHSTTQGLEVDKPNIGEDDGTFEQDDFVSSPPESGLSHQHDHTFDPRNPGTYFHCGVSSCGGLRYPDGAVPHGITKHLTDEERKQELLSISLPLAVNPNSDIPDSDIPGKCAISKLSARGKEFHDLLEDQKYKHGFCEINVTEKTKVRLKMSGKKVGFNGDQMSKSEKESSSKGFLKVDDSTSKNNLPEIPKSLSANSSPMGKPHKSVFSPRKTEQDIVNSKLTGFSKSLDFNPAKKKIDNTPAKLEKNGAIRKKDGKNSEKKGKMMNTISLSELPQLILTRPKK